MVYSSQNAIHTIPTNLLCNNSYHFTMFYILQSHYAIIPINIVGIPVGAKYSETIPQVNYCAMCTTFHS